MPDREFERELLRELGDMKVMLARVDERTQAMEEKGQTHTRRLNSHSEKIGSIQKDAAYARGKSAAVGAGAGFLTSVLVALGSVFLKSPQ